MREDYVYGAGEDLREVRVAGVAQQRFGYDPAGRTTSVDRGGSTTLLTWDADDHLVDARDSVMSQGVTARYDARGHRVSWQEDATGVAVDYVPEPLEGGLSARGLVVSAGGAVGGYVYDGAQPVERYGAGGTTYYLDDGRGSVIALVGATTTQRARFAYDAFGTLTSATGPLASLPSGRGGDYRYQGMWLETTTGLYHDRAREYDPATGRFLTQDAAEGDAMQPQTWLRYSFARNAPSVFTDPTGTFSLVEASAVQTAQLALVGASLASIALGKLTMRRAIGVSDLTVLTAIVPALVEIGAGWGQIGRGIRTGELATRIALGALLEQIIERKFCETMREVRTTMGVVSPYFEVGISKSTGAPFGNGNDCTSILSGDVTSRRGSTLVNGFPDVLFSSVTPSDAEPAPSRENRTMGHIEIKSGVLGMSASSGQFHAMVQHACHYSWSHGFVYMTAVGEARQGVSQMLNAQANEECDRSVPIVVVTQPLIDTF